MNDFADGRSELRGRYHASHNRLERLQWREFLQRSEYPYLYQTINQQIKAEQGQDTPDNAMARIRFNRKGDNRLIIPDNNIFVDHAEDIQNPKLKLEFSPKNYPAFDEVIATTFYDKKLTEKGHPAYEKYDGLRTNLAVVRNYIYGQLFPDGSLDEDDRAKEPMLADMANAIGVALERDAVFVKRPLSYSLSRDEANQPGIGAAKMYALLLKAQNEYSLRDFLARPTYYLKHPIRMLTGKPKKDWNLPPIENTPFSVPNLTAPLHGHGYIIDGEHVGQAQYREEVLSAAQDAAEAGSQLWNRMADEADLRARRLQSVATLSPPVLDESVEIAREILEKLKITLSEEPAANWLQQNSDDKLDDVEGLLESSEAYEKYLITAARVNPAILQDPAIREANLAAGQLAFIIKSHAIERMREAKKNDTADEMKMELDALPSEWKNLAGVSPKILAGKIEGGYHLAQRVTKTAQLAQAQTQNINQQLNAAAIVQQSAKKEKAPLKDAIKNLSANDVALIKQGVDARGQTPVSNLARPALDPGLLQQETAKRR